jgi:sulfite reductase (NADPH) flavoprotein alpha-component
MLEKGDRLFHWLEEGAVIYVCGDAQRMAKDVDKALHMIIEKYGRGYDPAEYLKALKHQNRYQRDIY